MRYYRCSAAFLVPHIIRYLQVVARGLRGIKRAMLVRALLAQKAVITEANTAFLTVMAAVHWFETLTTVLFKPRGIWQCSP